MRRRDGRGRADRAPRGRAPSRYRRPTRTPHRPRGPTRPRTAVAQAVWAPGREGSARSAAASRERRAAAVCTRAPLKACTNLSLSRGPRPCATPPCRGPPPRAGRRAVRLPGMGLLPAPPGQPCPPRGTPCTSRSRAPICGRRPHGAAGRGRRHRCRRRRAAPGRASRSAPRPPGRAAAASRNSSPGVVKVVGRLVEQECRGPPYEQRRQREP